MAKTRSIFLCLLVMTIASEGAPNSPRHNASIDTTVTVPSTSTAATLQEKSKTDEKETSLISPLGDKENDNDTDSTVGDKEKEENPSGNKEEQCVHDIQRQKLLRALIKVLQKILDEPTSDEETVDHPDFSSSGETARDNFTKLENDTELSAHHSNRLQHLEEIRERLLENIKKTKLNDGTSEKTTKSSQQDTSSDSLKPEMVTLTALNSVISEAAKDTDSEVSFTTEPNIEEPIESNTEEAKAGDVTSESLTDEDYDDDGTSKEEEKEEKENGDSEEETEEKEEKEEKAVAEEIENEKEEEMEEEREREIEEEEEEIREVEREEMEERNKFKESVNPDGDDKDEGSVLDMLD